MFCAHFLSGPPPPPLYLSVTLQSHCQSLSVLTHQPPPFSCFLSVSLLPIYLSSAFFSLYLTLTLSLSLPDLSFPPPLLSDAYTLSLTLSFFPQRPRCSPRSLSRCAHLQMHYLKNCVTLTRIRRESNVPNEKETKTSYAPTSTKHT